MEPISSVDSININLSRIDEMLSSHVGESIPEEVAQNIFEAYETLNSVDFLTIDLTRVATSLNHVNDKVKDLCAKHVFEGEREEEILEAAKELDRHQENAALLAELKALNKISVDELDIEKVVEDLSHILQQLNLMSLKDEVTTVEKAEIEKEIDLLLEKVADKRDYISKLPTEIMVEILSYLVDTPASYRALGATSSTLTSATRHQFPTSLMDLSLEILEYMILKELDVKDIAAMKLVRSHFLDMGRRAIARKEVAKTQERKMSILNKFLEKPSLLKRFWSTISTPSELIDEQEKVILAQTDELHFQFGTAYIPNSSSDQASYEKPDKWKKIMSQLKKYCPKLKALNLEGGNILVSHKKGIYKSHKTYVAQYFHLIPTSVESLTLGGFTFQNKGRELSRLKNLHSLKSMTLSDSSFKASNLTRLRKAKNLEKLVIRYTMMKTSDLYSLKDLENLRYIECAHIVLDDIEGAFDHVEHLKIRDNTPLTREKTRKQVEKLLTQFPNLKRLKYENQDTEGCSHYRGLRRNSKVERQLKEKYPEVDFKIYHTLVS